MTGVVAVRLCLYMLWSLDNGDHYRVDRGHGVPQVSRVDAKYWKGVLTGHQADQAGLGHDKHDKKPA